MKIINGGTGEMQRDCLQPPMKMNEPANVANTLYEQKNDNNDRCDLPDTLENINSHGFGAYAPELSPQISIKSLEDVDDSSSACDSDDSDCDAPAHHTNLKVPDEGEAAKRGIIMMMQKPDVQSGGTSKPTIGSIAVQNSSDITFGNKTFYQGPVTIKQFLLDKDTKKWLPQENGTAGIENPAFHGANTSIAVQKSDEPNSTDKHLLKIRTLQDRLRVIVPVICLLITAVLVLLFIIPPHPKSTQQKYLGDGDDSRPNIPINSTIGNDIITGNRTLRFVTRDEWIAQPPNNPLNVLDLPVGRIIIAHTATENCVTQASCTFRVRFIQQFHMESRQWDDIGYNFLVGGDGAAYEGRGWNKEGAHTKGYNVGSICIAFIGTFTKHLPEERQIIAAKLLIEEGIKLGKLSPQYRLYGARQLIPSESPGQAFYDIIKTWPHWAPEL